MFWADEVAIFFVPVFNCILAFFILLAVIILLPLYLLVLLVECVLWLLGEKTIFCDTKNISLFDDEFDDYGRKRKMTDVEKWVYSRHRTIFGAIFLDSYVKKEIRNAIKNGNVVEYENLGKIVYGIDIFDDAIILEVSGSAKYISTEKLKEYIKPQLTI